MEKAERDFKGVWISKDIWLNEDLTALDKVIYAEIDSLDNEDGCWASNLYMATFCGCSESKVSKTIAKLKNMGLITVENFDGRHRIIRVVKFTMQSSKKCYADEQKMLSSNIENNIEEGNSIISINTNNTTEDLQNFTFGKQTKKPKKDNLYSKCMALIDDFTDIPELHDALVIFLNMKLEAFAEKPFGANQFKGILKKLDKLVESTDPPHEYIEYVQQSIDKGWLSFYELKEYSKNDNKFGEAGIVKTVPADEKYLKDREEFIEQLKKDGKQYKF